MQQTIVPKPSSKISSPTSSPYHYSFPKASRFPIQKENNNPALLILPSTLGKKSCTFGFGRRKELMSRHCRDSPSPDSYILKSSFNSVNHSLDYSRQKVKERELFYIKPVPGPGSYNPSTPKKQRSPSCLISESKVYQSESLVPVAGSYNPNFSLTQVNTTFDISFTRSKKISFIDQKIKNLNEGKHKRSKSSQVNRIRL